MVFLIKIVKKSITNYIKTKFFTKDTLNMNGLCSKCTHYWCPSFRCLLQQSECRTNECIVAAAKFAKKLYTMFPTNQVRQNGLSITIDQTITLIVWPLMDGNNIPGKDPTCYKMYYDVFCYDNIISEAEIDISPFLK
jgi:hypothetical protein